jgi:hypothetical protein
MSHIVVSFLFPYEETAMYELQQEVISNEYNTNLTYLQGHISPVILQTDVISGLR